MAQIELILEKQLLTIQNQDIIASGDSNYDTCAFTFDESWEGFIRTAVFYQDKSNVQYAVLDNDDTCVVPAAAMVKEGRMYIGVFGIRNTTVLTSTLEMVDIKKSAISGGNVSTEPADDIFLAIIARYQQIIDSIAEQNSRLDDTNAFLQEQTELLQKVNAFEIAPLEHRMSAMEIALGGYGEIIDEECRKLDAALKTVQDSAFLIEGISVVFDENNEFRLEDARVDERSIVNAYFDAISVESLLNQAIYVESFDGYVLFSTTAKFTEALNCTAEVRRY